MQKKTLAFVEISAIVLIIIILIFVSLFALLRSKERADDAKKLDHIKEIQSALALYYHDNNDYPKTLTSGEPLVYDNKIYLKLVPSSPVSRGVCAPYSYKYERQSLADGNTSYTLEYCLSQTSADIEQGINTATPRGISSRKIK